MSLILAFASSVLVGCSSDLSPADDRVIAVTGEPDVVSVEQYMPQLPVLEAASLSTDEAADVKAKRSAKLIKQFKFKNGKNYTYVTVGDWVVDGDALITDEADFIKFLKENEQKLSAEAPQLSPQAAFGATANRWPNGIVYWERISLDKFNSTQQQAILNSMQEITNKTDIGFVGDTGQPSRITYTNADTGCWAVLGRSGGVQRVNLADNCFGSADNLTTIIHELGHAIGLVHEHNRPERDDYINVNEGNLTPYGVSQFQKTGVTVWNSYDYLSIMHYPRFTSDRNFVKDPSKPMFTTPGYSGTVRSSRLSSKDISTINAAY